MGNGEAKELICMTHGHERRGGMVEGGGLQGRGGLRGRNKWNNCSSIINKIYLEKSWRTETTLLQEVI